MTILPIVQGKDKQILRTKTKPVSVVTPEHKALIDNMKETMLDAKGVGIAAPQIDIDSRIIICRFNPESADQQIIAMVNPEITWMSDETCIEEEGCLSLPGIFAKVIRPTSIEVEFLDENAQPQSLKLTGYNARIVQHEVDHLDGILFIDRL